MITYSLGLISLTTADTTELYLPFTPNISLKSSLALPLILRTLILFFKYVGILLLFRHLRKSFFTEAIVCKSSRYNPVYFPSLYSGTVLNNNLVICGIFFIPSDNSSLDHPERKEL